MKSGGLDPFPFFWVSDIFYKGGLKYKKEEVHTHTEARIEVQTQTEAITEADEVKENDVNTWYTIEDGKCRYKGDWKNGLPNGKGIKHIYKIDSVIEGNFVDGFAEGYGKQTFEQTWEKSVPYYQGEFKRNNYNGQGEYHYGDGDYYKGEWKDGKYHGQGIEYSESTNRTWVGEYYKDKKIQGEWYPGEFYRGNLKSPIAK